MCIASQKPNTLPIELSEHPNIFKQWNYNDRDAIIFRRYLTLYYKAPDSRDFNIQNGTKENLW